MRPPAHPGDRHPRLARWRWRRRTRRRTGSCGALGLAPEQLPLSIIKTTGDAIQDRPLSEAGGKGLFTKELDIALLEGAIDLAVHSAKDLPTALPDGIAIAGYLPREDVRDAFISRRAGSIARPAARAPSSARRRCGGRRSCGACRPDLRVTLLRGNVGTRLAKLDRGEVDATLLAHRGPAPARPRGARHRGARHRRFPAGRRPGRHRDRDPRRRRAGRGGARADPRSRRPARRSRRSAPSWPCSTAPAGRRSPATRGSSAASLAFRGLVLRPDGSDSLEAARRGGGRGCGGARPRGRARAPRPHAGGFPGGLMRVLVTRPAGRRGAHRGAPRGARPRGRRRARARDRADAASRPRPGRSTPSS